MNLIYEIQNDEINAELRRKYKDLERLYNKTDIKHVGDFVEVPLEFIIEKKIIDKQIDVLLQARLLGMTKL